MKQILTFLGCLAIASIAGCAQASQTLTAVYSGMKFQAPPSPVIVGSLGQNNDILLMKYSRRSGQQYISFTVENGLDTGGCELADFFEAVMSMKPDQDCEEAAVASFREVVAHGTEFGSWKDELRDYYYFLSDQKPSFVFFTSDNGNLIKLESDFLDAAGFRTLLGETL
ncbi:MAG: hypothetical protein R3280_08200 [Marinobacter sp.]|uniref:hypothetical protein n=1 Tax=Marinobacter sp. TaxID=50741 RepID=UPI00299E421C|nr:hypothetical protein [Marinobacter sp.]MDX1634602.1 hypothetical protein [Marinobacter sp.]